MNDGRIEIEVTFTGWDSIPRREIIKLWAIPRIGEYVALHYTNKDGVRDRYEGKVVSILHEVHGTKTFMPNLRLAGVGILQA